MSDKVDDEHEQATDATTTVILEAILLDYSPALALKNPFTTKDKRTWPWSRRSSSGTASNGGYKRRQVGFVQVTSSSALW